MKHETMQEARAELNQIGVLYDEIYERKLIEKIKQLPEPYATALSKRRMYLQCFEKIAVDMRFSYRMVKRYCITDIKKFAK